MKRLLCLPLLRRSTDADAVRDRPLNLGAVLITFTGIRESAKLREIALLHPPMYLITVSSPLKPRLCLSAKARVSNGRS